MFSVLQQVVQAQMKDTATTARERVQAVAEKVMNQVVESETFKKHVAFNVEEHSKHEYANEQVSVTPRELDLKEQMFPEAPREPIGYVSVFVSRVAGVKGSNQPVYVETQVEGTVIRTPPSVDQQAFDFDKKMYDWDETAHTMKFPVTDIKTGIAVRIMIEGVLATDQIIGQVIIPLERLLPSVYEEIESSTRKSMEDRGRSCKITRDNNR